MKSNKEAKHKGRRVEALPCAETSSPRPSIAAARPAQMIERKEQHPARNRESRQTTAESGGGGLVSVFAPPYGEDEPPAFHRYENAETWTRGTFHRNEKGETWTRERGAKPQHDQNDVRPLPCEVLSSCRSLHYKPAPYEQRGQRLSSPKGQSLNHARRIGRSSTRQKLKNGLKTRPPESLNHKPRAVSFWPRFGRIRQIRGLRSI